MKSEFSHVLLPIKRLYCLDCEWTRTAHDRRELSTLAIEHAVEYNHDIDSEIIYDVSRTDVSITDCPDEVRLN